MIDQEEKDLEKSEALQRRNDVYKKIVWIAVPVGLGLGMTYFSNTHVEIQLIAWGIIILIACFGIWVTNSKAIRQRREKVEKARWDKLDDGFDAIKSDIANRFDEVDNRFDKMDRRFDLSENTDKTLLRNELVKFHREWVETKGYITLEALEYADRIHDAYNAVGGNDTGDQLWADMHNIPIKENRIKPERQH